METVELRPHHLVCLRYFVNRGYNAEFTGNTSSLLAFLTKHPELEVTVVKGRDSLCGHCPNASPPEPCARNSAALDRGWLKALGVSYGDRRSWRELCAITDRVLRENEPFSSVCSVCEWFSLCSSVRSSVKTD